ncbi:hypothetical protein EON65_15095 [archaeon]|nr:MAG: hypothetical protein EON65_15095 [archaeon]
MTNETPPDDAPASPSSSQYTLFVIIAVLVFVLGLVVGFVPLVLITKQETRDLSSLSGDLSVTDNSESTLSRAFGKAYQAVFHAPSHPTNRTHTMSMCIPTPRTTTDNSVGGLVLSAGEGMYVQWQDVGGSTLNRTSCLVWSNGPFGSGNLGLDTCNEANRYLCTHIFVLIAHLLDDFVDQL